MGLRCIFVYACQDILPLGLFSLVPLPSRLFVTPTVAKGCDDAKTNVVNVSNGTDLSRRPFLRDSDYCTCSEQCPGLRASETPDPSILHQIEPPLSAHVPVYRSNTKYCTAANTCTRPTSPKIIPFRPNKHVQVVQCLALQR